MFSTLSCAPSRPTDFLNPDFGVESDSFLVLCCTLLGCISACPGWGRPVVFGVVFMADFDPDKGTDEDGVEGLGGVFAIDSMFG